MMGSADMSYPSSQTPEELGMPPVDAACACADPPVVCMQDIIDHEYALVESIPDEDRAALMPIIRFVRNTLQNPFTSLREPSYGRAVDTRKIADAAWMGIRHDNHCIGTNQRSNKEIMEVMPHLSAYKFQCQLSKDMVSGVSPHAYMSNGTIKAQHPYTGQISESCQTTMSRRGVAPEPLTSYQQHQILSSHGALPQDKVPIIPSKSSELSNPHLPYNQADKVCQLKGEFPLSAWTYTDPCEPCSFTSFSRDPERHLTKGYSSSLDIVDGFNLEELRRTLRPATHEADNDVNDVPVMEASMHDRGDVDGEDARMDEEDDNNGSFLCDSNHDEEQDESDVEWPSHWGNENVSSTILAEESLQFPKVLCRRRNVIMKAVGWIKKTGAQPLLARVRHKRKCNLPCCTDCETATKRRKAYGHGSKKCARISTMNKIASSLPATTATNSETATKNNRQSYIARTIQSTSASSESCDDKEGSQVTQDWINSRLATVLTVVLMNSRSRGLTSSEALRVLIQGGYSKVLGFEGQALASHVKATLKECPQFKELKNHRFILKDSPNHTACCRRQALHSLEGKNFAITELSRSQVNCSEDLEEADLRSHGKQCQTLQQGEFHCRETDGKNHHMSLHTTTATSGCSSCDMVDSCDVYCEMQRVSEEDMLETVVDSCSGQSTEEHDLDQAQPIRCCRTDGKNWRCANQAREGSMYCERHQSRCKKGIAKGHLHALDASEEKKRVQTKDSIVPNHGVAHARKLSMQLRPRHKAALDTGLKGF